MIKRKPATIGDILTKRELERAMELYVVSSLGMFAQRCATEIIEPVLPRINAKLGQENDARFLAYCVEYALSGTSFSKQ